MKTMGLFGADPKDLTPLRYGVVTKDDKGQITATADKPEYQRVIDMVLTRPMVVGVDPSSGKVIRLKKGDRGWFDKLPAGYHGTLLWAKPLD